MDYDEALNYLYTLHGSKLSLENVTDLLQRIGDPQNDFKSIHVAGTNGKGSTCAIITQILQDSGFMVGRYISPYLLDFRERIVVNQEFIPKDELAQRIEAIKVHVDAMIAETGKRPTFFEVVTALAFQYFSDQNVDYAVIEVGLGGRLDATNVITPIVSAITNVSLEHTDRLGKTLAEITPQKAGIIKPNIPIVTTSTDEPLKIITKTAAGHNAPLIVVTHPYVGALSLEGEFQTWNAALAIQVVKQLDEDISDPSIYDALRNVHWPGRFDVRENFLFDCAHNPAGMKALVASLPELGKKRIVSVFGTLQDKDSEAMARTLQGVTDEFILVAPEHEARALDPKELQEFVKTATIAKDIPGALELAKEKAGDDGLILVAGSIYLVGPALRWYEAN